MIIIFVNSIITYAFEKVAVWHVALWWRGRTESLLGSPLPHNNEALKENDDRGS